MMKARLGIWPLATIFGVAIALAAGSDSLDDLPSRYADMDGVRIHYKSAGGGKTAIVFVHGWGCDARVWRHQVAEFSGGIRALYIDLPGHGESDKPAVRYSMDYLAEGVDAVVRHAGVDEAVLVGHSNGVPVVRQYYRRHPGKVSALIAVEGSFRPLTWDVEKVEQLLAPFRGDGYLDAVRSLVPRDLEEGAGQEIRSMMESTPQHVLVSTLKSTFDEEIWGEDRIETPTLVLLAQSPFWTQGYEDFVRGLVSDLEYRVYDGTSHFMQVKSPELFNRTVRDFLRSRELIEN